MDEKFEERTGEYEEREGHRLEHAGAIALFLLSPVFSYVMFEFVTGNFVMVLPKNAVLNIVWMFALYLLVFGISGETPRSTIRAEKFCSRWSQKVSVPTINTISTTSVNEK